MSRALLALPVLLLLACDPESPASQSGDPEQVTYAEELGVDLAAMEKRESGLFVQDLVVGDGAEVPKDRPVAVQVHYTGWLPDGTRFDSSYPRNTPITFTVGAREVIAGWEEGIPGMRVGGTRRLVIPSELGYGARAIEGRIPANSVLVFDVQLVKVL